VSLDIGFCELVSDTGVAAVAAAAPQLLELRVPTGVGGQAIPTRLRPAHLRTSHREPRVHVIHRAVLFFLNGLDARAQVPGCRWLTDEALAAVGQGLGRIASLHYCSSALHQIHEDNRYILLFLKRQRDRTLGRAPPAAVAAARRHHARSGHRLRTAAGHRWTGGRCSCRHAAPRSLNAKSTGLAQIVRVGPTCAD
jgi:hypothetical protein